MESRLSKAPSIAIIGAGIGGLVAALTLARQGFAVTVHERAAAPGGKMREIEIDGRKIDAGPTVFTMRWVFEAIFEAAGSSLDAELKLSRADILARHAWRAGETFDLHADRDASADAIGRFAGAEEARRYLEFCERAAGIFKTLDAPFMRSHNPSVLGLMRGVGPRGVGSLFKIQPFTTMWQALGRYFHDPRLRQLFARYATYCGASPFAAPATLMLIAHVEQEGVWLVEGGMHRLAQSLCDLAKRHGAVFRFDDEICGIETAAGAVSAVISANGERQAVDAVIVNADASALAAGRFGEAVRNSVRVAGSRSLSAVTWSLVAGTGGFPLARHNVFFSSVYAREFQEILVEKRLPSEPTIYVCAQDRSDEPASFDGPERLFCLVNAPAVGDADGLSDAEIARCEDTTFNRLRQLGLSIDRRPERMRLTGPAEFDDLFPATGGALYGRASHGWRASFERPGLRTRIRGLYLAGGSVHPGPGVPMAALSGQMAAECLISDRTSRGRSRATAMPGGMSTRSAKTRPTA